MNKVEKNEDLEYEKGGLKMLQVIIFSAIVLVGMILALFIGYRNRNYHSFMMRQSKFHDDEYDRIYGNS